MKALLPVLLCLLGLSAYASPVRLQLQELNSCWKEHSDVELPASGPATATGWIRLHLTLVEQTLRTETPAGLNAAQRANREKLLNELHQYRLAGNFPVNDQYAFRTPIFIDRYGNFCAVGFLIKQSGQEALSRKIAARTNLAYVRQIRYPELTAWAAEHGFTVDELAWIQPAYSPTGIGDGVGRGTDGEVKELYADEAAGRLYVGGLFSHVDSTIPAQNIAYVTESGGNYSWHSMGQGVNGPVYAIAQFDNKIFVAGSFSMAGTVPVTNVAYWDGSSWHAAGCTYGEIRGLVVYNNELYACGDFDVCAAMMKVNFAKWDGTMWQQYPILNGIVYTMEVWNNELVLGGSFSHVSGASNVVKWTENDGFQAFGNNISNEVRDFERFGDTLYAACRRIDPNDSLVFLKLQNNSWSNGLAYGGEGNYTFNTLCNKGSSLAVGGQFQYVPMIGTWASNTWSFVPPYINNSDFFPVDDEVNKMILFKGVLYAGGRFKTGNGWTATVLNGIARDAGATSVPGVTLPAAGFDIYPNPAAASGTVTVRNDFGATYLVLRDLNGRVVMNSTLGKPVEELRLPELAAGVYTAELGDAAGNRAAGRITIE